VLSSIQGPFPRDALFHTKLVVSAFEMRSSLWINFKNADSIIKLVNSIGIKKKQKNKKTKKQKKKKNTTNTGEMIEAKPNRNPNMHSTTTNLPTECFLAGSAKLKSPTLWSSRLVEEEVVVECLF
jgi:hypothetical protein